MHFRAEIGLSASSDHIEVVLSIGKVTAGQAGYYEQQVAQGRDDYYAGEGEAVGEWQGEGADALGLDGEVTAAAFNAAFVERRDPTTGDELGDSGRRGRVLAYDLTFSAPKSVSVLYAVADAETSPALRDAHDEAVGAARDYLEREACFVRRGAAGAERLRADGFVAAGYRHRMSRAQDPQLHTHLVTANLARGADGRWTALDGRALYRHAKAAGYLYEAHLRHAVRERLPWVRWSEVRNGIAEIEGVPDAVLREFSRRRAEIAEWLGREGRSGARSAQVAALATRAPKDTSIATPTWREATRARAAEQGLGRREIDRLARSPTRAAILLDSEATAAQLLGRSGLTERRNTFAARDAVLEWAAAHPDGAPVASVEAGVRRFLARPGVVRMGGVREERFTTRELLDRERSIVETTAAARGLGVAALSPRDVDRALAGNAISLTDQQRFALLSLATSGHGIETVEALAGTGKTHLAGALRAVYADAGYAVVGAAPTGRAARELRERAGMDGASTLARLLIDLDGPDRIHQRTVVILDEAGMASTREASELVAATRAAGAKLVAIGDSRQLASVDAGGWLGSLRGRFGARELTEVMRQRDAAERELLARVHERMPAAYLRHKHGTGELHVCETTTEAEAAIVSVWRRREAELAGREAVMIARDNAARERLNAAARELLSEEGRLAEAVEIAGREFAVGDRVIARRNDRFHDVDNGMRGTVRAIDDRTGSLVVETDASGLRELPGPYVAEHVEHAYALTGHGMQGGTVEWAGVVGPPEDFTANWSYTALSRAREPTEIYVVAAEDRFAADRAEIGPAERDRRSPLGRMAASMRVRDDEDLALDWIEPPELPAADRVPRAVELTSIEREAAVIATRSHASRERQREQHVRTALASPGPHLERTLGPRPRDRPAARDAWERAATAIERYRFDQGVCGRDPLGARPVDREARVAYQRARREIDRANRRLGREASRVIGLEL